MSLKKSEILGQLFKDYGLYYNPSNADDKDNDVYTHKHYKIITRSGVEKIQKAAGITISYKPVYVDGTTVVLQATGKRGEETIETFSSASAETSKSGYYAEMAEKRAMSRIVLKLAGLYQYGVFGQDESDDFKRTPSTGAKIKE